MSSIPDWLICTPIFELLEANVLKRVGERGETLQNDDAVQCLFVSGSLLRSLPLKNPRSYPTLRGSLLDSLVSSLVSTVFSSGSRANK